MSRKGHVTRHDIEMYLCEKLPRRKLEALKDKLKKALIEEKQELENYRIDYEDYVYRDELELYLERNEKNIEVLNALKIIFPNDKELSEIDITEKL